jgi:tRNA threonylcarbamoyladenosine biosynthesis protein TsaE
MARERRLRSSSPAATERLGEELGRRLVPGALVALDGELGSGKTCLVRGLARGLGVTERVTSPTYALLATYPGRLELLHFDAWMEGRERAFLLDGGLDCLASGGVAVIEWAERVLDVLPATRLRIELAHAGHEQRTLRVWIEGPATSDEAPALAALARALEALVDELPLVEGVREDDERARKDRERPAQ